MRRTSSELSPPREGRASGAVLVALALVMMVASISGAQLREEPPRRGFTLEPFLSVLVNSGEEDEHVGLRGSYHWGNRWAFETGVSRFEVGNSNLDIWALDLSAKFYFDQRGRSRWYVAGGPSKLFRAADDLTKGPPLYHLGIGSDIALSRRLYLRPDIRALWRGSDIGDGGADLSLGLGWRFP